MFVLGLMMLAFSSSWVNHVITIVFKIQAAGQFHTNFVVTRVKPCASTKSPINLRFVNVTTEKDRQFLNFDLTSQIPLDENVGVDFLIEYPVTGTDFVELFTIRQKSACKAANQYMGEFWYEIERAAQIAVGVCPILAGHYYVHHHFLDFKRVTLQTFPFGDIRFTLKWFDNKNRNLLLCLLMEVHNKLE